jgi:hypothetical protein
METERRGSVDLMEHAASESTRLDADVVDACEAARARKRRGVMQSLGIVMQFKPFEARKGETVEVHSWAESSFFASECGCWIPPENCFAKRRFLRAIESVFKYRLNQSYIWRKVFWEKNGGNLRINDWWVDWRRFFSELGGSGRVGRQAESR